MWLRAQVDEPLGAAGVGAGEGHADGRCHVAIHVDLVTDGVAGTAVAVAAGVTIHDGKVGHHPMEALLIEEAALNQPEVVGDGEGRIGGKELDLDGALLVHLDEDVREAIGAQGQHEAPHDVAVVLGGATGVDGRDGPPGGGDVRPVVFRPGAQLIVGLAGECLDEIGLHGGTPGTRPVGDGQQGIEGGHGGVGSGIVLGLPVHHGERGYIRGIGGAEQRLCGGGAHHEVIALEEWPGLGDDAGVLRGGVGVPGLQGRGHDARIIVGEEWQRPIGGRGNGGGLGGHGTIAPVVCGGERRQRCLERLRVGASECEEGLAPHGETLLRIEGLYQRLGRLMPPERAEGGDRLDRHIGKRIAQQGDDLAGVLGDLEAGQRAQGIGAHDGIVVSEITREEVGCGGDIEPGVVDPGLGEGARRHGARQGHLVGECPGDGDPGGPSGLAQASHRIDGAPARIAAGVGDVGNDFLDGSVGPQAPGLEYSVAHSEHGVGSEDRGAPSQDIGNELGGIAATDTRQRGDDLAGRDDILTGRGGQRGDERGHRVGVVQETHGKRGGGAHVGLGIVEQVDEQRESLRIADAADGERCARPDDGVGEGDATTEHGVVPLPGILGGEDGGEGFDACTILRAQSRRRENDCGESKEPEQAPAALRAQMARRVGRVGRVGRVHQVIRTGSGVTTSQDDTSSGNRAGRMEASRTNMVVVAVTSNSPSGTRSRAYPKTTFREAISRTQQRTLTSSS